MADCTVVTNGVALALLTSGDDWFQAQWMVADLGVGVGLGRRKIAANCIGDRIWKRFEQHQLCDTGWLCMESVEGGGSDLVTSDLAGNAQR